MEHLFLVRHGDYDVRGNLKPIGRSQIELLASEMKRAIGEQGKGFGIMSSTAPRAEQTADIIAKAFGLPSFERNELLFSEGEEALPSCTTRAIDSLVSGRTEGYDSFGVSSHWDVVYSYTRYLLEREFGLGEIGEEVGDLEKGQAMHFDFGNGRYDVLPSG